MRFLGNSREILVSAAILGLAILMVSCSADRANTTRSLPVKAPDDGAEPTPEHAFLQNELLASSDSGTESEIGNYDFRNHTYPLPRGWQHPDSKEITLRDGHLRTTEDKIGMEYVTTKFFDVTGDGEDEAAVILRIGTGGSAIPQLVYIYRWKKPEPELVWYFRTGDRADGGLKTLYADQGDLVVELFGQDRYIFDHMETLRIVGDEEPLCCPTHFTRTRYRRSGKTFVLKGKRLTYSIARVDKAPVENMGTKRLREDGGSRK